MSRGKVGGRREEGTRVPMHALCARSALGQRWMDGWIEEDDKTDLIEDAAIVWIQSTFIKKETFLY